MVQNGLFDAAGICYDENEFKAFTADPSDTRPKDLLTLDKDTALRLCPHAAEVLGEDVAT